MLNIFFFTPPTVKGWAGSVAVQLPSLRRLQSLFPSPAVLSAAGIKLNYRSRHAATTEALDGCIARLSTDEQRPSEKLELHHKNGGLRCRLRCVKYT